MTSTSCTYRKTRTGKWAVMGPASVVQPGRNVTVVKRDGSTKVEAIESVGKPFFADGSQMIYGYPAARSSAGTRRPSRNHSPFCDECGERATPGTQCWETGFAH